MEIPCKDVIRAVSEYLDGELLPASQAEMEAHFARCRHCLAILDGTRNVVRLLGDGRCVELPADFGKRLFDKIKE